MVDDAVLNVRWTWAEKLPQGKRPHYDIPDYFVNTTKPARNGIGLGIHVRVVREPFSINFTQDTN